MQSSRDFVCVVVLLSCALLALTLAAPVSDKKDESSNQVQEKGSPKSSSPEEELDALQAKAPDAVVKAPSAISEEKVEEPTQEMDEADKRSDSYLPVDTNMLQPEQQPELSPIDDQLSQQDMAMPALDLSPKTLAEYLLLTGDWQSFDQATADLMDAGVLTPTEADQYREEVAYEYERLMRQLAEAEAAYLEETADPFENYDMPLDSSLELDANMAVGSFPSEILDTPDVDLAEEIRRLEMEELMEKEEALDELLEAIVEDYVDRAQEQEQEEELQQQEVPQQLEMQNPRVVQVLDIKADTIEGEISDDNQQALDQQTGSDAVAKVEEELESLGQAKKESVPKKLVVEEPESDSIMNTVESSE